MATTKKIVFYHTPSVTLYCLIFRESDGYVLDQADNLFKANMAAASDPYYNMTEDGTIGGRYTITITDSTWNDGKYTAAIYEQGVGPIDPVTDAPAVGLASLTIKDDAEVIAEADAAQGTTLVSTIFSDVRTALHDDEENLYPDSRLVVYYNRIISEILHVLIQMGAEICMKNSSITGDGVNQTYSLPSDFRAFVPQTLQPRNPITATTNYTHGKPLYHADPHAPGMYKEATTVGTPVRFCIIVTGTDQYVKFNVIPQSGQMFDYYYYPNVAKVTEATIGTTYTPWLSLLDPLISRSMEEYCREGLEFTTEKRALWRARAEADAAMLLGLRHLKENDRDPSIFKGMNTSW